MVSTDSGALELRFRGHDDDRPPAVEAFSRSPARATSGRPEAIGVWGGRRLPSDAPLKIFLRHASYGIPPIGTGVEPPDLSNWSVRPTLFGYLADVPRPTLRSPHASRAWIVAACLPLVLVGGDAMAAPSLDAPAVQRPAKGAAVPDAPGDPIVEPEREAVGEPDDDHGLDTDMGSIEPPVVTSPEPSDTGSLAPTGPFGPDPALVDAAWEGVHGFDVVLTLKGDRELRGRVGAVQRDTFTLIQAETGMVLVLPKSTVVSLRVHIPAPPPESRGTGLIVGGSVLGGIGTPIFLSGVAFLAICPSCTYIHLPMLLVGGGALAAGIPMLIRGAKLRKTYNRALRERALSPLVGRSEHGWTGGLRFRF